MFKDRNTYHLHRYKYFLKLFSLNFIENVYYTYQIENILRYLVLIFYREIDNYFFRKKTGAPSLSYFNVLISAASSLYFDSKIVFNARGYDLQILNLSNFIPIPEKFKFSIV